MEDSGAEGKTCEVNAKLCAAQWRQQVYAGRMKAPETVLLLNAPRAGATEKPRKRVPAPPANQAGSWRYGTDETKRWHIPWIGILISGAAHAYVFLGVVPKEEPVIAMVAQDNFIELMEMPKLEDLDEPELVDVSDGSEPVEDAASFVPMLADLPSTVKVDSFIQQLDFSTLEVKPDFSQAKIVTIPPGVRRGGSGAGEGLKNIFNLADLDRIPEAVFQPPPVFPPHLKKEVANARVDVEFVVTANGKVVEVSVVYASMSGFEDAAVAGVSRWQFRPGMKGGRKVNTRMRVPIMFRVLDGA